MSAITWGHNDKRLFVSTGNEMHVAWVSTAVPTLQLLSRLNIHRQLKREEQVRALPLPCRIQNLIGMLFCTTIRVRRRLPKSPMSQDKISGTFLDCKLPRKVLCPS